MTRAWLVVLVFSLLAGCGMRAWKVDMVVNAYEPRPEHGQDAAQTAADVDACRTKLLREPGQLEPQNSPTGFVTVPAGYAVAIDAERTKRYERCLTERGYTPVLRPIKGGPQ